MALKGRVQNSKKFQEESLKELGIIKRTFEYDTESFGFNLNEECSSKETSSNSLQKYVTQVTSKST